MEHRQHPNSRIPYGGSFYLVVAALIGIAGIVVLGACASMGRPEGGPRDEMPPVFVRSTPKPGALNVTPTRIEAFFDENIQLEDAFNKVIVSPTQKIAPVVRSLGKRVTVELRDTLQPNTTYTIDFADAIKDLNEGNVLDGFALDFSTGNEIDTLRISGMVLAAQNLEPAQGMTVGIYREPADTAIHTMAFERVARTNQYGQFTVRNLKPGAYAVYALNDVNRDNKWDRSEDIAFISKLVVPSVEAITVSDTLRDASDQDSIVSRPGIHYLPDDVLLTWFNEGFRAQYLKDYKRLDRRRVHILYGAPTDSLPTLRVVGGPLDGRDVAELSVLESNTTGDSLVYWMRDPALFGIDSLTLSVRHEGMDSLQNVVWQTDTLKFFWKEPKESKKDKKKKDEEADSVAPPVPLLTTSIKTQSSHEIYQPVILAVETPIESIDTAAVHFEIAVDTLWQTIPTGRIYPDALTPSRVVNFDFERQPGAKYRFTVDSLGITDIYGVHNRPVRHEFTVKQPEEYANLIFHLSGADSTAVVELLNGSDNPVMTVTAPGGEAVFRNITPATYYARMYLDSDRNGKWSTGSIRDSLQPEEVYYYPKTLVLRANWDVEQSWDIYETPLDKQKPNAIKKNKPKLKKGEKESDETNVEYDEWGEPIDPTDTESRARGNRTNNSIRGFGGGFQQASGSEAQIRR